MPCATKKNSFTTVEWRLGKRLRVVCDRLCSGGGDALGVGGSGSADIATQSTSAASTGALDMHRLTDFFWLATLRFEGGMN